MSENFIKGQIVKLKSGSPVMTVGNIENDKIQCTWYDTGTNSYKTEVFFDYMLVSAK